MNYFHTAAFQTKAAFLSPAAQFAAPSLPVAGISHVSFHDLRHDHASRLFAQGEHPRDVQDRLGHSSITLTMDTYTHAMPGRQENIAGRLEGNLPSCLVPVSPPTARKFKIKKISLHHLPTTTGEPT
ncbi:tyrosine-type recombinase/integrase [Anaerospora hongkongensis]|uniref:tyrosine-type recombinase/integrase n=1 Tax=Anaerospora hongkongensis TaxID=244830 RepID=UPI0028A061C0|nr:tyrosine-type recombinase/integrase [Anaerospora hongkongensis]